MDLIIHPENRKRRVTEVEEALIGGLLLRLGIIDSLEQLPAGGWQAADPAAMGEGFQFSADSILKFHHGPEPLVYVEREVVVQCPDCHADVTQEWGERYGEWESQLTCPHCHCRFDPLVADYICGGVTMWALVITNARSFGVWTGSPMAVGLKELLGEEVSFHTFDI